MPGAASGGARDSQVQDFFADPDRYRRRNADLPVRPVAVRRLLGDCAGQSILDLGCGDGSLTIPLCGAARLLVLLDRSVAMLEAARASLPAECAQSVRYETCDLSDYRSGAPFDVVVCVGVLAHVPSIGDLMATLARLVRPGGRCVVQFTDGARPSGLALHAAKAIARGHGGGTAHRPNFATARRVVANAGRAGLLVERIEHYSIVVPGLNRLPAGWRRRYARWTVAHPMPCVASEAMVLLRRVSEWRRSA